MPLWHYPFHRYYQYFLRRKINCFFISISLRSLALGLVLIYEPIYLYLFFGRSLSLTCLFFAATFGLQALLAVFIGKMIARIGTKRIIFLSHFLYFSYYLSLHFLKVAPQLIILSLFIRPLAQGCFWPAFHLDFSRFAQKKQMGRQVGRLNLVLFIPTILGPFIGGAILNAFNYGALFAVALLFLLFSMVPLSFASTMKEFYTDSYFAAWQRAFQKENRRTTLALAASGLETAVSAYLWPLFLAILSITYLNIGGIASFSLGGAVLFSLYLGRISEKKARFRTLNIGAFFTSLVWVMKYFVKTSFDALLARTLYRLSRTTASVPFRTIFYEKAAFRGKETDEFIIYREITINLTKFLFLFCLAGIFVLWPYVNLAFIFAAIASLGLMFLGRFPKIKSSRRACRWNY